MLKRVVLRLISAYQRLLSPWTGNCCRFEPSCSRYAALCFEHHRAGRALWLTVHRLLRCNPLSRGGIDLPPGVDAALAEPNWERVVALMTPSGQSQSRCDCAAHAPAGEH